MLLPSLNIACCRSLVCSLSMRCPVHTRLPKPRPGVLGVICGGVICQPVFVRLLDCFALFFPFASVDLPLFFPLLALLLFPLLVWRGLARIMAWPCLLFFLLSFLLFPSLSVHELGAGLGQGAGLGLLGNRLSPLFSLGKTKCKLRNKRDLWKRFEIIRDFSAWCGRV